jgi:hypothetical protein
LFVSNDDYIKKLVMSIRGMCPVDALVEETSKRNRLKILQPWLEQRVQEGNQVRRIKFRFVSSLACFSFNVVFCACLIGGANAQRARQDLRRSQQESGRLPQDEPVLRLIGKSQREILDTVDTSIYSQRRSFASFFLDARRLLRETLPESRLHRLVSFFFFFF